MIHTTIYEILKNQADDQPGNISILGLERAPLTYGQLFNLVDTTIRRLNELGIGRNDPIAFVLPNGPEMGSAFLSIASGAIAAPLNPAYKEPEFEFFLNDLDAKALITLAGYETPAKEAAQKFDIPIVELTPDDEVAGLFKLSGSQQPLKSKPGPAMSDDVALVLHTSGTTSRPKIVPLTQKNLTASAYNINETLRLTPKDRCLNIMPLFHIHGLIAATLTSMLSGASLVCTPGFLAPNFFKWMDVFQPSWYTGVPTMHQAILAQAEENQDVLSNIQLRFVRSASSSLPPLIMAELEKTFNTPVIEAYGMTEVSHQIACNPLPPLPRKPGSVGPAAGPEVAIMEESGDRLLAPNTIGEIVIRGKNVTMGYAKNPEANKKAFVKGWFRTGDQGYIDEDGYIYITGRLKEIINRGGEKISPREIDEILLNHPAVKQALAFSLPDEKLGEDIAAAVVLKEKTVNERDLREYTSQHLAHFKVPRQIIILEEIPKGPTGKLQRIGLAEKLGLDKPANQPAQKEFIPPRTPVEKILAELWCEVLGLTEVSVNQEFLNLGGDSMLATQLLSRIQGWLEIEISLLDFFDAPTIAEQAGIAEKMLLEIIEGSKED